MREVKRVLFCGKHIFIILVLFTAALVMLRLELNGNVENDLGQKQEENQETYVWEYNQYYDSICTQAKKMLTISIFSEKNSFSYRNIEKTVEDFEGIKNWKIVPIDTSAEKFMLSSDTIDYILFAYIFFIALSLIQERKSSMWQMVHAASSGRGILAGQRIGILCISSTFMVFVLYMLKYILTITEFKRKIQFEIPIQSIREFQYVTSAISIRTYLIQYLIIRVATLFAAGLIIWFLLSWIRNTNVAMIVTGLILAVEYGFSAFLTDGSILVLLKYANIFSLLKPQNIIGKYLNLNLFGFPINVKTCFLAMVPVLLVGVCLTLVLYHTHKRPISQASFIERFFDGAQRRINPLFEKLNFMGLEIYKTLIPLKGVAVLLLFSFFLMKYAGVPVLFLDAKDFFAEKYYQQQEGRVTEETIEKLQYTLNEQEQKSSESEDGNRNEEYFSGLNMVIEDAGRIYAWNQENPQKQELELLSPYAVKSILGIDSENYHNQRSIQFILIVVLLYAGIFAYENEKNMKKLILSSKGGRNQFFRDKMIGNLGLLTILYLLFFGAELYSANQIFGGFSNVTAPAGSMGFLEGRNAELPILALIIFVYTARLLMVWLIFAVICFLSLLFHKVTHAVTFLVIAMVLPMAFLQMGYSIFEKISLSRWLNPVLIVTWSPWSIPLLFSLFCMLLIFIKKTFQASCMEILF
ncbi:MAG: hypothetical protein RSF88_11470 [Lachnospiraceae bacterium]